jgi:hypothetical protein
MLAFHMLDWPARGPPFAKTDSQQEMSSEICFFGGSNWPYARGGHAMKRLSSLNIERLFIWVFALVLFGSFVILHFVLSGLRLP